MTGRAREHIIPASLGPQQFDLADGGGAVVEPELAALHLVLALEVADRGLEAPDSDLAVAASGDDAATERERGRVLLGEAGGHK